MASDITRKLFDKKKHYSGVIHQQGRVTIDTDPNEQLDIQLYRTHTQTKDVVGKAGVPKKNDGFRISLDSNLGMVIKPGRIYVEGLLCELEEKLGTPSTYLNQPYYPDPDTQHFNQISSPIESPLSPLEETVVNIADGTYIIYIDAWQREVNYLDDPLIQEVALGEADTTTRLQTVWQVKLLKVDADTKASCKTTFTEWTNLIKAPTGKLKAQTSKSLAINDPCSLKPSSGFRGLENQLYRVEIHKGGNLPTASFKWSRNNATLETTIESVTGSKIKVTSIGKDELLSFAPGQWVEIIDHVSSLHNNPNSLLRIAEVDPSTREIVFSNSVNQYAGKERLKLRRWDQPNGSGSSDGITITSGWISLEDGIEIQFSTGSYRSGDYWLIPARTATAEIEWPPFMPGELPLVQSPKGVPHYYSKLALLKVNTGLATLEDCRDLFPALTDLCAEDIGFKNDNCDMGGAQNVQEALDLLCAANDLRDHNKHLHGYGVVCGLKVRCGFNRQFVTIENGYALDCEGNIVRLKKRRGLDYSVVTEAATAGLLDNDGNGEVSLRIAYNGKNEPSILIEQYVRKNFWEEVLEGTLIKDYFDKDIKPLFDFVKKHFVFGATDTVPVPIEQQRITAVINLLFQLLNSATGPYIFLSGLSKRTDNCDLKPEQKQNEDQLLYCLYQELKSLLASQTFCGMFDNDHPFPGYKIEEGLDTIFGPTLRFHNRLRIHPLEKFAYTCGRDSKIYVYDLSKRMLHDILSFPSTSNIKLQDIAISSNGKELYATGLLDDKDSVIAIVSINATSGKHDWVNGSSVKCAFKYVSLAYHPKNGLYGAAKGKGLFKIESIGTPSFKETKIKDINATGILVIPPETNIAYVAASNVAIGTETSAFDRIDPVNIDTGAVGTPYPTAGQNEADDLCIVRDKLYVSAGSAGSRLFREIPLASPLTKIDIPLDASSTVRFAYAEAADSKCMLIVLSDLSKVVRWNFGANTIDKGFRIPVQVFPFGIATTKKGNQAYVLNTIVNTLTAVELEKAFRSPAPNYTEDPPLDIAYYHDDAINAFKDLMKHILLYLKDAFCNRFIIDCPTCNEGDHVYLGTVMIKNRKVYRICNFSKRRYVKTFRTWGYWLSTVPILPLAKKSFARFCCTVLEKQTP